MPKRLQKQISKLYDKILDLGTIVEERVKNVISAFQNRDEKLALEVIEKDSEINDMEVEIEEECLKVLALYQPVAIDLRILAAIIKINNDLERVGDEAVNIGQRILTIVKYPSPPVSLEFNRMAEEVEGMLRLSLDSLVRRDIDLAYKVCKMDPVVDEMNWKNYRIVNDAIKDNPEMAEPLINMLLISRHLERIADHATNIAEDMIYIIEGEIPRHRITL